METKSNEATATEATRTWLTVPQVAYELHIPRTRCYELIARGELPAVRIGERSIRINRRQLEEYLLSQCSAVEQK